MRSVTVSVVSHGQAALVRQLLQDLQRHGAAWIAEVVVTVNIPESGDPVPEGDTLPARVLRNASPRGFGANHNAAFAHCRTPWFLVLNPDLRFDADVIGALLAVAQPGAGVLAPRIREPGKDQPEPFRRLLTPWELVGRRFAPRAAPPRPDWIAGMFMLLDAAAYRAVGGFDERFHMYVEDADLCARLRLAGWTIQVVEGASVLHDAQRDSWRSARSLRWHVASLLRWWLSPAFRRSLSRS